MALSGRTPQRMVEAVGVRNQELLAEFASRLARLNYARTTRYQYVATVRRFLASYPDLPPDRYTPEHIERFLYAMRVSPRTICTRLEELRAFCRWLKDQKRLVRTNPCDGVEKPRWTKRIRPAPSEDDFQRVRALCRSREEAVMLELLFFTGLRVSELRRLRTRDVDLVARKILVVLGKGAKDRITIFPQRVAALLRRYSIETGRIDGDGWLFPSTRVLAYPRGCEWIQQMVARLGRTAQLPYGLTPRVLRHGWVRLMKVTGMPVEFTAKLAGHSSIKTTVELYGELSEQDLRAAYDRHVRY